MDALISDFLSYARDLPWLGIFAGWIFAVNLWSFLLIWRMGRRREKGKAEIPIFRLVVYAVLAGTPGILYGLFRFKEKKGGRILKAALFILLPTQIFLLARLYIGW